MNDREREAYLNRIGYEGELRTDKKCLEKIMDLHLCSIPFENLEVFDEGRIPSLKWEDNLREDHCQKTRWILL